MITDREHQRLLAQFGFLAASPPDFQAEFFSRAQRVQVHAGQPICRAGTQCTHLPLVVEGRARVYQIGENGREITLYRVKAGECCVLTASCLLSARPFPAFVVCEEPIEALVIQPGDARRWLGSCEPWRQYLFGLIMHRLIEVFGVLDAVLFQRLDQRLIAYLLAQAERLGASAIPITHQTLASELGSSREVISRLLKGLEDRGLLKARRGQVELVDPHRLRDRLQDPPD
ncbi:Crp/Fnr family transcriptional regulator [Caldichromatium japonicum]|uniref:Crp/Fnr family transcriptional regulator n=1 Tax=Caldichromatium japonicum TaxID=2699430 RepID=A0A6G7VEB5_9GAMM|nr:Crp/Fnr family transcriptional regulator [Caldichromatium japonicum]QIK38361.1 Crp/Fnr family transcriptional regulator [Caldichromatium japonicum]